MCGIFGFAFHHSQKPSTEKIRGYLNDLFLEAQRRGKDASGLAVYCGNSIYLHKAPLAARALIRTPEFKNFLTRTAPDTSASPWASIGHCRLATDGSAQQNENNQPLQTGHYSSVLNGIIVNDDLLWKKLAVSIEKHTDNDAELFLKLFNLFSESEEPDQALGRLFAAIEGNVSAAILDGKHNRLLLGTNSGSLYYIHHPACTVFASEKSMLERFCRKNFKGLQFPILQLKANEGAVIDLEHLEMKPVFLPRPGRYESSHLSEKSGHSFQNETAGQVRLQRQKDLWLYPDDSHLKRCQKCILPETMPFIEFDEAGICNYCRVYQKIKIEGRDKLLKILEPHRKSNGDADCIIAFSGGRDSSYGLHVLKKELGMNPVAYSYDWGILTDIGRRNQARMCAQLGVEHIIVSADIAKKRDNVRKNVNAWMKKPDLGLIPLFMAGDKQFFHYANQVRKETGIDLMIFCFNNLERVDFKASFCGINNVGFKNKIFDRKRFLTISAANRIKLGLYYAKKFMGNPAYLNRSLADTFWAYLCYYFIPQDHISLFAYLPWDEKEIDRILIEEYDWEISKDTTSTWRIGDGTAAFYNYIYRTVCGFTENDGFRSNQIREGLIGRDEALARTREENRPRRESILEYLDLIGIDANLALETINAVPRLY